MLGAQLAPGVPQELLRRDDVLLLVDGVSELVADQRRSFLEDVGRGETRADRKASFIFAGRDAADFSAIATATYSLVGLRPEARQEIAASLVEDPRRAVREIEEHLGDLADNPLLFTMALALREQDIAGRRDDGEH